MSPSTKHKKSDTELLYEKIKGIKVAMMTTVEPDGTLCSRPMAMQDPKDMKEDGKLWFFTQASAPKVGQVEQHHQVNLSYAKPDDNLFVSVSGTGELVRDRKRIKDLWRPFYETWFPKGLDDPELALLCIHIDRAEFWSTSKTGLLKGLLTGNKEQVGEDIKLDV